MRKRQPAVSHSSSSLNGLFRDIYAKKICDLMPNRQTNVTYVDYGKIEKRKGINLFDINKATYSLWNAETPKEDYKVLVHPGTYQKLMEDTMATSDYGQVCENPENESQVKTALRYHKNQVSELRAVIARKQEQLRIALALLAAVKKLDKGSK